jgi:chemotaxis protein MotB
MSVSGFLRLPYWKKVFIQMTRKKVKEELKQGAPAFIVTFSDMVTLLLTFFVMLLSLAKDQVNDHKFLEGLSSFKLAVADFGMTGAMYNQGTGPEFEYQKIKYKVEKESQEQKRKDPETKSKDHHTEMLRRLVMDIEQMMKISPAQIAGKSKMFIVTTIRFAPGNWELSKQAKEELDQYSLQIQETLAQNKAMLYVVGVANTEQTSRAKWMVSSRRANEVAEYIKSNLPQDSERPIYSWGSGTGGEWCGEDGLMSRDSEILLALIIRE